MRARSLLDAPGTVFVFIALAALGTLLLYGHTLDYGFNYDDYVLVRPHATGEVVRSFYGHWDPTVVRGWSPVPAQIQEYLARKREPGAPQDLSPNPADELSHAIFGVHGVETGADGVRYQWMSQPAAEILVLKPAPAR